MNEMPGCSVKGPIPVELCGSADSTAKALSMPPSDKEKALTCLRTDQVYWRKSESSRILAGCGSALQSPLCAGSGQEASPINFHEHRMKSGEKFKHPDKWIRGRIPARHLFGRAG